MTTTISRLYNNYGDARAAVQQLEAAGVAHSDISIIASNADNWYNNGKDTWQKGHVPTAKWVSAHDVKAGDLPADHSRKLVFYCANPH